MLKKIAGNCWFEG